MIIVVSFAASASAPQSIAIEGPAEPEPALEFIDLPRARVALPARGVPLRSQVRGGRDPRLLRHALTRWRAA